MTFKKFHPTVHRLTGKPTQMQPKRVRNPSIKNHNPIKPEVDRIAAEKGKEQ